MLTEFKFIPEFNALRFNSYPFSIKSLSEGWNGGIIGDRISPHAFKNIIIIDNTKYLQRWLIIPQFIFGLELLIILFGSSTLYREIVK